MTYRLGHPYLHIGLNVAVFFNHVLQTKENKSASFFLETFLRIPVNSVNMELIQKVVIE